MAGMINKLSSTSGESIAETLVAVLIAALALLMLAGTINSASRIITRSQQELSNYYSVNNQMTDYGEKLNTCKITVTDSGSLISETWETEPYRKLTSTDSKIIGDHNLVTFG